MIYVSILKENQREVPCVSSKENVSQIQMTYIIDLVQFCKFWINYYRHIQRDLYCLITFNIFSLQNIENKFKLM